MPLALGRILATPAAHWINGQAILAKGGMI